MAYLKKRGEVYYLIDKNKGKEKWVKLGPIKFVEAKSVLARYETDQTYLRLGMHAESPITFNELSKFYVEYASTIKAKITVDREEEILDKFAKTIGSRRMRDLKAEDLEALLKAYDYKANSIRLRICALRALYAFAIQKGYLKTNIALQLKKPKIPILPPKSVDPKIIDKIFKAMTPHIRSRFLILYYTGMRPSEMLRLQAQDINLKNKELVVRYSKTKRFRVIPLHNDLIPIFSKLTEGKNKEDYLFPSKIYEHQIDIRRGLKEACDKAKVKGVTPYVFRHQFATTVYNKTKDLRAVQQLLGHTDIRMTTRYATALNKELRNAVDSL